MLSGAGKAPIWKALPQAGIIAMAGAIGSQPYAYFIDYPIFGAATGRDLFDHLVNLGTLTRLE